MRRRREVGRQDERGDRTGRNRGSELLIGHHGRRQRGHVFAGSRLRGRNLPGPGPKAAQVVSDIESAAAGIDHYQDERRVRGVKGGQRVGIVDGDDLIAGPDKFAELAHDVELLVEGVAGGVTGVGRVARSVL